MTAQDELEERRANIRRERIHQKRLRDGGEEPRGGLKRPRGSRGGSRPGSARAGPPGRTSRERRRDGVHERARRGGEFFETNRRRRVRTSPRPGTTAVVSRSREERGEESYGQRARLRVRSGERREYRGGSSAFRGEGSSEGRARRLSRLQHLHRRLQDVCRHRPADGVRHFSSLLHRAHRRRRQLCVRRGDRPGEKRRRDGEQRAPSSPRDDRIPLRGGGLRRSVDERRWREERTKRGGIAAREFTQEGGVRREGLRGHRGRAPQAQIEEKTNRRAALIAPRPRPREPPRGANQSLSRRERRGGETSASVAAEEVREERETSGGVQRFLVESGTL